MSDSPVLIIAEAGVNHNGDMELARRLVEEAARAGADVVKFQTFKSDALVLSSAPKAAYQNQTTGSAESQAEMLKKLELTYSDFIELKKHCEKNGVIFCSTAFDEGSVDFLHGLKPMFWKIPSGEITNTPYLRKIGAFGQDILLSTGMAILGEVEYAINTLISAGASESGITLLHCTTEYPTPLKEVNLKAMLTLRNAFPNIGSVGYSDHTQGIEIALAAAALGATVIEKHFTLDRSLPGPDHQSSLEPDELASLVRGVRNISMALGNGKKSPSVSEIKNIIAVRKSLVASRQIRKGEILNERNMTVKRPGSGISPMRWDEYCGSKAARDYEPDEMI